MRPLSEIHPEFLTPDQRLDARMPILDAWVGPRAGERPLADVTALLVQHQLSNHIPQLSALLDLGLDPRRVFWLDIPYTAHDEVTTYARDVLGIPGGHFARHDYRVLEPYATYQHHRALDMLLTASRAATGRLLVLDDGAYVLEALASLSPSRWPRDIAIVEQTTRGFIKLAASAALRLAARRVPLVDVARSQPKKRLEPPFIGMAVCSALEPLVRRHLGRAPLRKALVLGYGAIGEQVATFVRERFALPRGDVHVHDPTPVRSLSARRRGFPPWDREDFSTRFQLVLGCSGEASFSVGDHVYLEDGALLASASSGAVELSRQDFIELADASELDDLRVERSGLDERDVHADLRLTLVDRGATFANGGFPVNFDRRLAAIPTPYMQPTATMMVAAAVQAARTHDPGVQPLDPTFCRWIDEAYRAFLGERAAWLDPPPEEAW